MSQDAIVEGKKKRGRPRGSKNEPKEPASPVRIGGGTRSDVSLGDIDLDDTTFQFRLSLRIGDLARSIGETGQQFPVLLRRRAGKKLQVVSGFRRIAAIRQLRGTTVSAVVRDDLDDDAEACRISILENEVRKTYNDLDRARAIVAYREIGKTNADIGEVFQLGKRHIQRLKKLTSFPETLQHAIADGTVSSTNAVRLMQHVDKYREDVNEWIEWIRENQPTFAELNKALNQRVARDKDEKNIELFVEQTKSGNKSLRLRPISINSSLTPTQCDSLLRDIDAIVKFIQKARGS